MSTHRYPGGVISATPPSATSAGAVGVWTLEEALKNKAAGNWPDGSGIDPYFRNTTLLLHGDGTNGAQNNTFLDSSTNNFTITRNGNTTQGSFDPYVGPGNWSNYFDGTGDYLSCGSNTNLALGAGNFTVECWIYPTSVAIAQNIILDWRSANNNNLVFYLINSQVTWRVNQAQAIQAGSIAANAWTHLAVVRNSTTTTLYVNGAVTASFTDSNTYAIDNLKIGGDYTPSNFWNGYLSNIRIVKGAAVYTTAFTPSTTPLVATTQTVLLTCNNNGFIDQSAANNTLTRNGDTLVSKFSPFTLYQITPTSYSGYFDGSGDYLSIASNAAFGVGTGDFTIEYWAFYNTFASSPIGFDTRSTSGDTTPSDYVTTGGNLVFYYNSTNLLTSTNAAVLNRWNHIAWVRSGTTLTSYINGVASGSVTSSANFGTTQPLRIAGNITAANFLNGSISNFRFVKGTAVYTTGFTPPTAPLTAISGTSLLTCQSTTFIDNSTNAFALTVTGNATPRRANPFTDTVTGPTPYATTTYGGSAYFDGTGDYLSAPANAAFNIGTNNFTAECWFYTTSTAQQTLFTISDTGSSGYSAVRLFITSSQTMQWLLGAGGAWGVNTTAGSIQVNSWTHVAVTRSGSTVYFFINGAQVGTATYGTSLLAGGTTYIGFNSGVSSPFVGYVSNLRFINGTAVYTTPFVPPAAPVTAVTNTQLLVNATNGGIFDNTTISDLETVGNAQISTSVVKYGTGSIALDGNGDYLSVPYNSALSLTSGDFTIEGWFYCTTLTAGSQQILNKDGVSGSSYTQYAVYITSSGVVTAELGNGNGTSPTSTTYSSGVTASLNTWTHFALVRTGTTIKLFVNGVQGISQAQGTAMSEGSKPLLIGYQTGQPANQYFNGYLDDLRITKGYARYTTNFTPPTGPFPNI